MEGPQNRYRIATRLFSCRTFTKSAGYCRFVNANQPFHGTTGRPFRAGLQKRHVGDGLGSDFSGDADLPRANLFTALSEARHCHHPRFSEERYDKTTRIIIDFCFLIATGVCFLPIVLYSGALALNSLFHVGESLQISHGAAIWLLVILLGLAGILYAVIGGLRAMAVADSINGIGLVIGGLMVPVFGLIAMGKGSFMQGIEQLTTVHAEKLNSIGGPTDPLPIGAAFTGLILVNTFYWCTNQGIVQRTLASKSLAEGQKGALLTAVLKMLDPLVLVLPGLIAFHLYQDLPKADMAYPTLVNNVLPVPMVGFFGAVLFGAVISTFNGFLNSASTLFSMGIYRRIINQNAEPQQLVTVGRKFGFFIAIVSVLVAPWIANAPQGLYSWMKQLNGIHNVPLVTIIIMGFFFPRIPALAAKVAMGIGIISYITINYLVKFDFHFLYVLACTFCINVVVMLVIGFIKPRATPFTFKDAFAVDMKPWRNVKIASIGILFAMIGVYAGLAEFGGYGTRWLAMISYFIAAVVIVYLIFDSWRHRHDPAVTFTPDAKDSL